MKYLCKPEFDIHTEECIKSGLPVCILIDFHLIDDYDPFIKQKPCWMR